MNISDYLLSLKNSHGISIAVQDGELKVKGSKDVLSSDIVSQIRERKTDILNFFKQVESKQHFHIKAADKKDYYTLSSAQRRLHFLYEFDKHSLAYNMPRAVEMTGILDVAKFTNAFKALILHHEILRTSFERVEGVVFQKISAQVDFKIAYYEANVSEILQLINAFIRPFDLHSDLLIRVGLIKIAADKHILLVDTHHIVVDGVSQGILLKDFMSLYNGDKLLHIPLQYKDYAEWQQSEERKLRIESHRKFWLQQFEGEIPVLDLPTDFARPLNKSYAGNHVSFSLSKTETASIKKLIEKSGTTMFMTLLSVFNILLSKVTGQEDITIGTPIAGREHADLQGTLGMFVNTVALRNYPHSNLSFLDFLLNVKSTALSCFENQSYQYDELISDLKLMRNTSRNLLYDVWFVLQNFEQEELVIPGLALTTYDTGHHVAKLDLTLSAHESDDQVHLNIEYPIELFTEHTINRFAGYFKAIVSAVTKDPAIKISRIDILPAAEKKQLLNEFNNTSVAYPSDKTVVEIFERQAEETPDRVALVLGEKKLTYKELNECGDNLASKLQSLHPDCRLVALYLRPSLEMIIGILGVLKSGMAFLPLDPDHKSARHSEILSVSNCDILVTSEDLSESMPFRRHKLFIGQEELRKVPEKKAGKVKIKSSDVAYVIYTSGSTGKPKGVVIGHNNIVNYVSWFSKFISLTVLDKSILTSSYAFDLGYTSIFPSLLTGGELHLISSDLQRSSDELLRYIYDHKITYLKVTPSLFSTFLTANNFSASMLSSVRYVVFGGESIKTNGLEAILREGTGVNFINHYGPTETTIGAISQHIARDTFEQFVRRPTIGRPINNTRCYVLDKDRQLTPLGTFGELCIGGAGVGQGYLSDEVLTGNKFVDDPFLPGEKMYRTGDLARWLSDGTIEFLSRADDQVKIRGFRVELAEVERHMIGHAAIKAAVVLAKEMEGDNCLVGYYVSDTALTASELRSYLGEHLPDYMLPLYYVHLKQLPLTRNGKVDRSALPEPTLTTGEMYVSPEGEVENTLVAIWSEVLNIDKSAISVNANFFEIGGHSLRAISMLNRVRQEFGVRIRVPDFFKTPTIRDLDVKIMLSQVMAGKNQQA